MRDLLIFMIVFGSLPFIIWRPYIGVLMWTWLAFMNPHRLTWGAAFDFPFSMVVILVLLPSLLLSKESKRIPITSVTIIWLIFFLWTWLTTQFALIWWTSELEWSRWWKVNLVGVVTLMLMGTRDRLQWMAWITVLSLGFFGVKGGIFSLATGAEYRVFGPQGSFIEDNNALGLALIMVLPLMRYLQLQSERKWVRLGLWVAMGLTMLSIFGTHSRGALLGIAAMILVLVWRSKERIRLGLVLLVLTPLLLNFMPEHWFNRMESIQEYQEDGSAMGRINAWWFAYNVALDRPLIGGGFGVFNPRLFDKYAPDPEDFHDSHSIYFEVLGEQGFVGLGIFLLLGFAALRTAGKIIKSTKDRPDLIWASNLASMLQVALIGYAVGGAFLGLAYFDLYYHLVAMIVLTQFVVQRELGTDSATDTGAAGIMRPT